VSDGPYFFINSPASWFQRQNENDRISQELRLIRSEEVAALLNKSSVVGNCIYFIWQMSFLLKLLKFFKGNLIVIEQNEPVYFYLLFLLRRLLSLSLSASLLLLLLI
jgi:hypothetical protein